MATCCVSPVHIRRQHHCIRHNGISKVRTMHERSLHGDMLLVFAPQLMVPTYCVGFYKETPEFWDVRKKTL